jgi:tRNA pseudouridine55 synthase
MEGVLVVDKPEGITSHDVVAIARRALREKRIGHTGTLDPLATGVLPLACGRATRLVRFLTASDKTYEATIRFGITTDSYDITGNETGRVPGPVSRDEVLQALEAFRGDSLQTPPPYSAKKVDGVRAYTLARRDEPVELKPVPVRVSSLELTSLDGEQASVRLTCSAGYYVRTFAHLLGQAVGTGACLEALRRTRSGEFHLDGAITVDALLGDPPAAETFLIPLERLLPGWPTVTVTDEGRMRVSHGRELNRAHYAPAGAGSGPGAGGGWIRLLDSEGHLLALAQPGTGPDCLHPEVVLT